MGFVFSVLIFNGLFSPSVVTGQGSSSPRSLSGYAWSSNIGWISFKGSSPDYGVTLFGNNFSGYAWSSNIGWIRFFKIEGEVSPDGGDSGVSLNGSNVEGWARACSVFQNGCSGSLKSDSERGGWDGWIKMDPMNDPTYDVRLEGSSLKGFAWGSDVVGWIDFCVDASTGACVTIDSLDVDCKTNGLDNPTVNVGETVTWTATAYGGLAPHSFCWGTDCGPDLGGVVNALGDSYTTSYLSASGPDGYEARVRATDSSSPNANSGEDSCTVIVSDLSNTTLNVSVQGRDGALGKVTVDTIGSDENPAGWTTASAGCQTGPPDCSATYPVGILVTLVAVPGAGQCTDPDTGSPIDCAFDQWHGGVCSGSDSSCSITMDQDKYVTAIFKNPLITETHVSLNSTPAILRIDSHNAGQIARTPLAIITASVTGDPSILSGAKVCLDSFANSSGMTIDQIVSDPNDKLECHLDGLDGFLINKCVRGPRQCRVLRDVGGGQYQVTFRIQAPTRLTTVRDNGPYRITFSIDDDGLTGNRQIPFIYNTGGGGP